MGKVLSHPSLKSLLNPLSREPKYCQVDLEDGTMREFSHAEWNEFLKKNTDSVGNHMFKGLITYYDGQRRNTRHIEYSRCLTLNDMMKGM